MIKKLRSWLILARDRRGVTALEYALIAGIVVTVIGVGFGTYASDLSTKFTAVGTGMQDAPPPADSHRDD